MLPSHADNFQKVSTLDRLFTASWVGSSNSESPPPTCGLLEVRGRNQANSSPAGQPARNSGTLDTRRRPRRDRMGPDARAAAASQLRRRNFGSRSESAKSPTPTSRDHQAFLDRFASQVQRPRPLKRVARRVSARSHRAPSGVRTPSPIPDAEEASATSSAIPIESRIRWTPHETSARR